MAYDKFISIACGNLELTNLRGVTSAKVSEEIDSELERTLPKPREKKEETKTTTTKTTTTTTRNRANSGLQLRKME